MNVSVEGLSLCVEGRQLLNGVRCHVAQGDLVALMGPSGAGKTTLLNALAGRGQLGLEGAISYDGQGLEGVRSSVGYVTQEDIMYETLTPRENLSYTVAFMWPELSSEARSKLVEEVIERLSLQKCSDTVVGSPGLVRGISGGERKRTNVALSLLGSPSLLLLDEPTSGLDSKMSDSLMRDVRAIADQGCTVIATIHQPSEAVFGRFSKVLLLETGRVAYYGPVCGLRASLSQLGFPCPPGTPLPELLVDLLETEAHGKLAQLPQALGRSGPAPPGRSARRRGRFAAQLAVLFRRELRNVRRSHSLTAVRVAQTVLSSLLIGLIFLRLESNMGSVQPRLFSSFLLIFAQFMFALLGVVNAFPQERAVFLREAQDKLYHPAAFYLAKVIIEP